MQSENENQLCFTSFNSTGFGLHQQKYIETLLLFSDIFSLQEHFLLDSKDKNHSNTNKIRRLFGNKFDMYIVPAYKSNEAVSKGRGKGGLSIMWKKSLTKYVSRIPSTSFRILAAKFSFPSISLLVVNTYFMCDPRADNFDDTELLELLDDLRNVIVESKCRSLLWAGDLNTDFSRNTRFVEIVRSFILDLNLLVFWSNPNQSVQVIDFTFSQTVRGVTARSTIDHFVGSSNVFDSVVEAGVVHSVDNPSNHSAIFCKLNIGQIDESIEELKLPPKPSWAKASAEDIENYKASLELQLQEVQVPDCIACIDPFCREHHEEIEDYCNDILEAIDGAAKNNLPYAGSSKNSKSLTTPGWNEHVGPYQKEAKFWFSLWESAGRPSFGDLYQVMRESKMQYKYAVRRLKKAGDMIKNDKFVQDLLRGGRNIFKEVKQHRGQTKMCSSTIDGTVGSENIAEHFANIYSELYSKVELDDDFDKLSDDIKAKITDTSDISRVNESVVREALKKMKAGKSDTLYDFSSDCLINGPDSLIPHLTNLFKIFISHGKAPVSLLVCSLVPIVKDSLGDLAASDNYRAIAIGSLLLKLLDWIILILEGDKLSVDELQFGFQGLTSTTMCTWSLTATIDYYKCRGRTVYGCAMDCSKAFDLVSWTELFTKLRDRGLSPLFLRLIIFIYRNQSCDVKWNGKKSHRFAVSNGVRQGAVSSPILFCLYVDSLIKELRSSGLGCQIGGIYLGIAVYADDIFLLSASRNGLQSMVDICQRFAEKFNLRFSTNPQNVSKSKTKCIIFSSKVTERRNVSPILLDGAPLPWVEELKHLGNIVQSDNSMTTDITVKRAKFIGKVHSLNQEFYFCNPYVVMNLYKIYACSFYSSSLFDLFGWKLGQLYRTWNKAVRILFNVPMNTHTYLIETISKSLHPKVMLSSRFVTFHKTNISCKKPSVRLLASLASSDQRTSYGRNLRNISNECNIPIDALTNKLVKKMMTYNSPSDDQKWRVGLVNELLEARLGMVEVPLSDDEINDLLSFACSS